MFRALFAEYFNHKGLYRFVGQLLRLKHDIPNFEFELIVVTTEQAYMENIKKSINFCGGSHSDVKFVNGPIDNFLKAVEGSDVNFDYIEFNGGVNIKHNYRGILSMFREMLAPEGVIGLTAYVSNNMVDEIR